MARSTDVKVARPVARPVVVRQGASVVERLRRYLREVRAELTKVEWPNRQEMTAMTTVTVLLLVLMASYLGAADALFTWVFQKLGQVIAR